jgi:uncharacterized protein
MAEPRKFRAPDINPESKPFWDAASDGKLMLKHCTACDQKHYYPRSICPLCGSSATEWFESNGKGSIYTLSTMRRGANAPYTLAWVMLDDGPAIVTNIATDEHDALAIGQRVTVTFVASDGGAPYPLFTPDGE